MRPSRTSIATLALVISAVGFARTAAARPHLEDWLCAAAPLVAAALLRVNVVAAHAVARAIAWLHVVVGAAIVFERAGFGGTLEPAAASFLGAVVLAALGPASYDAAADASGFTPTRARRLFLGAATASTAMALLGGLLTIGLATRSIAWTVLVGGGVLGLFVSTGLVLRMRALGVALGGAIPLVLVPGTIALRDDHGDGSLDAARIVFVVLLFAVPPLAYVLSVLWARSAAGATERAERTVPWSSLAAAGIALLACARAAL